MSVAGREYHGIVVKEGVKTDRVFHQLRILGQKAGREWTLFRVSVEAKNMNETIQLVQANLLSENGVPYYAHFYRDDELIVVFPERVFHVRPDRDSWKEVVSYGESLGIPAAELDFRPCKIEDETY